MTQIDRGACYYDTENNDCPSGTPLSVSARNANLKSFANAITGAELAWLYWEVLPNADPHVRAISAIMSYDLPFTHSMYAEWLRLRDWYR